MLSNYILILFWIAIVGYLASSGRFSRMEIVEGQQVTRLKPWFAIMVYVPLIYWCGHRGWVGDTGAYMRAFWEMPDSFSELSYYYETLNKDKGFYLFSAVIKCLINNRVELYFIIMGAIQLAALIYVYRKYSEHFIIAFFLYIASTDYLSWNFNGMRQFTAVAITFFCFELILKKKYIPAIIIIIIASRFHGTALLVIPFMFICQGEAWNKKTVAFLIGIVIAIAFLGKFTNILDSMLSDTQYKNVVTDYTTGVFKDDDGTNVLRVLVYSVPAILSWFGRKYIREANNPVINLCTNMSIVSTGFYIVSMFTSGIFIGRLPIYFSLYGYILLPWLIDNLFKEDNKKIVYISMISFYLLFYFYGIHFQYRLV